MNESHKRHLVVTLGYIDQVLREAEQILATAGSASPFARYTQDSSPLQRKVIGDSIDHLGQVMAHIMADLDLPHPAPICGALWAAQTQVSGARIAVAELRPKTMRGYGTLSTEDIERIDAIVAKLDAQLEALMSYITQGSDADFQTRLKKLEQTHGEVPLLRELERIITAHGLMGLRGTLSALLDRLEDDNFEIGVFGRVSSGKSSLLNHLFGATVLPVGVTPVTALPASIRCGTNTRATIEFARSPPITVSLDQLAEYCSEEKNPGNQKRVKNIIIEVQTQRLPQGMTWVDTPGLGALEGDAATETEHYLPRCDLGLVLVDAGSTLTQEDLVLVQKLLHSGADVMVLVSKADLLSPSDRQRFVDYVRQQLATQFGTAPPVSPVSIIGDTTNLCDLWFDQTLQPLLLTHRAQAAASMKRKAGLLREAVTQTLRAKRETRTTGDESDDNPEIETDLQRLHQFDCGA